MDYLDIIEENFTKEEFVAYLRGRILEYLLSEQPLVLSEFKRYANKLVDVVKDPSVGYPLEDTPKGLQTGKWYHTKDFTVEELSELLPKGTTIETEKETLYAGIDTTPPEKTEAKIVNRITTSVFGDTTLIEVTTGNYLKEWFKITEE